MCVTVQISLPIAKASALSDNFVHVCIRVTGKKEADIEGNPDEGNLISAPIFGSEFGEAVIFRRGLDSPEWLPLCLRAREALLPIVDA